MKSKTSSCKKTALRKDFGRFWPVWVGYILCLIVIQAVQSNSDLEYWYAANMAECIGVMGVVNCGYAVIVAGMLFGDLFNTRMCNGLHSLPLKREQWFSVHVKAGFLFSLIPTALMVPLSEAIIFLYSEMLKGWQIPLLWFAAANIQYIFFFGLAVFCVMCAGSRFAALVVYGILNFFSILVYLLVDQLYTPLLFGVVTMSGIFELLCPVYKILETRFINTERLKNSGTYIDEFGIEQQKIIGSFEIRPENWIYILVLAAIGIALLLMARKMYQKRKLECAGDFLAVRWLEPVFQVVFTVLCAAGFHGMFLLFFGLIVGWFAGRMFLERSTRVFRLKNFAGFALVAAVMAGSLYVTALDPMDIEDWVPEAEDLQGATLQMNYRAGYNTEDPEEIEKLIRLHELALEQKVTVHPDYTDDMYNPYDADPEAAHISLRYTLDNGWLAQRNYYVLADGEGGEIIREFCSRVDVVIARQEVQDADDLRHELKDVQVVTVNSKKVPAEFITDEFRAALADAIIADCEAGNMVQSGVFHTTPIIEMEHSDGSLYELSLDLHGTDFWSYLYIYADCENVLNVLEPTGVIDQIRQEHEDYYG